MTKMSTGELIVDGSVTADKMNVKGLTVSDGSKNTLAIDNAGNVSLDVKSLRITGSAAATQSEAQGYASSAKSEAISAAASDATTKANNAKTDALNAAKTYTDNGMGSKLDASWMTQKNIFDKLTNNGALEGIYMEGGKLYINAEYIQSGTISANRINGGQLSGVSLDIGAGNFKVSDIGDVRATRGTIAGWNLTYDCFWKGISFSDKFIYSTSTGELEINGKILASSGYIGDKVSGFTIGSKAIYNGMTNLASAATGIYLGTDGISLGGGKIKATSDGKFYATDADISGNIKLDGGLNLLTYNDVTKTNFYQKVLYTNINKTGAAHDAVFCDANLYLKGGALNVGDTINGISYELGSATSNSVAGALTRRDGASDISVRLIRSSYQFESSCSGGIAFRVAAGETAGANANNYIRFCNNPTSIRNFIGAAESSHQHGQLHQDGTAVVTTSNAGTIFRASEARGDNKVTLGSS